MSHRHVRRTVAVAVLALVVAGCGGPGADSHIASAKTYLQKQDYPAAIIELKNALAKAPDNAAARMMLAQAFLDTGNPVEAEAEARKAIELKVAPDETYPVLAKAMLLQGQWKKLLAEMGNAPVESPGAKATIKADVALAYAELNLRTDAEKALAEAAALDPKNATVVLTQARFAAASGKEAEARKAVDSLLATSPDSIDALLMKGDIEAGSGNPADAQKTYAKVVELRPDNVSARYGLVISLVDQRKIDEAAAHRDHLKKVAPRDPRTLHSEAMIEYARGNIDAAYAAVQKTMQAAPEYLPVLYLSALIDLKRGSYQTAESSLQTVLARVPGQENARRALAEVYLRRGTPAQAMATIEPSLRGASPDAGLLRLAGEIELARRNPAKSAEYYERANALDKDNVGSQVRLAQVRLAQGDTGKGIEDLQALAQSSGAEQPDLALIATYVSRREFDKALAAADALIKKQPKSAVGYNAKGGVQLARNDVKGARASFDKALSVDPNFRLAAVNLVRVDVLEKDYASARKRLDALLEKNKNDVGALLALADVLVLSNAPATEVTPVLERAVAAAPSQLAPRLALIRYLARQKDWKATLAAAQAANAALPDNPVLLEALGSAQLVSGETNQAVDTFRRIVTLAPKNVAALMRLADAQARTKDFTGATASLRQALLLAPDNAVALISLAAMHVQAGTVDAGLADAKKLQKDLPTRQAGYALEGELLLRTGKTNEGLQALRVANSIAASSPLSVMRLHAALTANGKQDEAAQVVAKWMKDKPQDMTVRLYLADRALLNKDYKTAEPLLRTAAEKLPDNPTVLNNYAWTLTQLNDPKGLEYAERAHRLAPGDADVMNTYGVALMRTGKTAQGVEMLRKSAELAPGSADKHLELGKALLATGDKAGARTELEAAAKGQSSPAKAEAENLLKGM